MRWRLDEEGNVGMAPRSADEPIQQYPTSSEDLILILILFEKGKKVGGGKPGFYS